LAAHHFPVFTAAFAARLRAVLAADDDAPGPSVELAAFLDLCLAAPHTFLYSQALLTLLARDPAAGPQADAYRRVLEETHAAAPRHGLAREAARLSPLHHALALNASSRHRDLVAQINAALGTILQTGTTNPVDIAKLHRLYTADDRPLAQHLHHAAFLDLLLTDLFNPTKAIPPSQRAKHVALLAIACGTRAAPRPPPPSASDAAVYALLADDVSAEDSSEVGAVQRALEGALALTEGVQDDYLTTRPFAPCLRYEVVSMGVLKWVDRRLTAAHLLLESPRVAEGLVPSLLRLVAEVSRLHPGHWPACLELLERHFRAVGAAELDSTVRVATLKLLLMGLLYIARLGFALPVLHAFAEWLHTVTLDLSLIRTFLYRLLSTIQPPFSARFVAALVPIILDPKVTEAISSSSLASSPVPYLVELLQYITRPGAFPTLGPALPRLRILHATLAVLPG